MIEPYKEIVNGCEFWMQPVEGGRFLMGSSEGKGYENERPQHEVHVSDFYLGRFPVTQALWQAIVNEARTRLVLDPPDITPNNPSSFRGDDLPVEQVTWAGVQAFIKMLNNLTQSSRPKGHVYRMPSEAEWEYAARGGKYHIEGYKYAGSDRLKDVGWFEENSGEETKPVGFKSPNQLGIHDMSGNVWEWCEDWYRSDYYEKCKKQGIVENPLGPEKGTGRVHRGGSWRSVADSCGVADRGNWSPDAILNNIGFRLALSL